MAVTRHIRFVVSMTADSIFVLGSATFVKLSHAQTGSASGKTGLSAGSAARHKASEHAKAPDKRMCRVIEIRKKTKTFISRSVVTLSRMGFFTLTKTLRVLRR